MRSRLLIAIAVASAAFTGCKHDPFPLIGGKGGNASLIVYPQHHGATASLDSMMIYIKYNTLDAPANGRYDDSALWVMGVSPLPSRTFTGLWNGNYYIYSTGIDYNIPGQRLKGGLGYTIRSQQPTTIMLPVGEE